jgi:hypothetical protein
MAHFIKLEMQDGLQNEYLELDSIVHVLEKPARKGEGKPSEVQIALIGGSTVRLSGAVATTFLKQFEAHITRMHPTNISGPGHSALSP